MASSPAFASLRSLSRASAQRELFGLLLAAGLAGTSACVLETRPGDGLVSDGREIQVQPTIMDPGPPDAGIPTGMGGTASGPLCKNLALFQEKVVPHYVADCVECHGGMKPKAVVKLDLSWLKMDPEVACYLSVVQAATPADPLQAELLTSSDPARPDKVHDFKYKDPAAFARYREDVLAWLTLEKAP